MKLLRNTLLCALALMAGCLIFVAAQGKQKVSTALAAAPLHGPRHLSIG